MTWPVRMAAWSARVIFVKLQLTAGLKAKLLLDADADAAVRCFLLWVPRGRVMLHWQAARPLSKPDALRSTRLIKEIQPLQMKLSM